MEFNSTNQQNSPINAGLFLIRVICANPCPMLIRVPSPLNKTHCVIGLFAFVKPGQKGMILSVKRCLKELIGTLGTRRNLASSPAGQHLVLTPQSSALTPQSYFFRGKP